MSKLFLFIFLLSISFSLTSAKVTNFKFDSEIEVGKNPIFSFHWGTVTHVFCAGADINNDGQLDFSQGDEEPTWWTIGRSGNKFVANQMKTFEFNSIDTNFIPAVDLNKRVIYLPFKTKFSSYELLTTNLIKDDIYTGNLSGAIINENNLYIVDKGQSDNNGDFSDSKLVIYDIENSNISQEISINTNPQRILLSQNTSNKSLFILFDPTSSNSEYSIAYSDISENIVPSFEYISLNNVKQIAENNTKLYITFEKSDKITILKSDGSTNEIVSALKNDEIFVINKFDNEIFTYSKNYDIRFIDDLDNIDYITKVQFNPKHMNYWNTSHVVVVPADKNERKVYFFTELNPNNQQIYRNVGKQPAKIVYSKSNDSYNIFCLGYDANFNGQFDEGDELPSWWVIKGQGTQITSTKVFEFQMGDLKFPLKFAYDDEIDLIYIPHKDKVSSYDVLNHSLVEEIVYAVDASSVDMAGPHLMFSVRKQDAVDELLVFDRDNSNILQTIPAGENILQSVYFTHSNGLGIAILNEGTFGSDDASLMYGNLPHMQAPNLSTLNIGMTGNDLDYYNGNLGTVSNGSHNVNILNFESGESYEIKTGTSGYNGPRNISLESYDDFFFVTTYDNDIRLVHEKGLYGIIKTPGKVEDIYVNSEKEVYLATIIFNDDYSPNNQVLISGNIITSVENNDKINSQIDIYPNPSSDYIFIRNNSNINSLEIYNLNGELVLSNNNLNNLTKIDLSNLISGIYIVKITDNHSIKTTKINVVK